MGSRPFIVLGDSTSHGGTVAEASCMTDTHGKGIARVGDQVTCPIPGHGTTVIVSGDPTMIIDGKPAARHGDKCACGATLISSQVVSTTGDGGASNPQAASQAQKDNAAAHGVAPAASPAQTAEAPLLDEQFDQTFLLIDQLTSMPLVEQPYIIHVAGRKIRGISDETGHTQKVSTGKNADDIEIEIIGETIHV